MPQIIERLPGVNPDLYISFADDERGFLGAVVVPASDLSFPEVLLELGRQGLNPGGEAAGFLTPPSVYPHFRRLSRADLEDLAGPLESLGSLDGETRAEVEAASVGRACGACQAELGTRQP